MKHHSLGLMLIFTCALYAQPIGIVEGAGNEADLFDSGISSDNRAQMAMALNTLLSNEFILYTKTLKYHWNVTGPFFGPLHSLFRTQYETLNSQIDMIAERVRSLGHKALGTLEEFSQYAVITEQPNINPKDLDMIHHLLKDHETIIKMIRTYTDLSAKLNDMGSNNFLATLLETHEKMAWMLRAHLVTQ